MKGCATLFPVNNLLNTARFVLYNSSSVAHSLSHNNKVVIYWPPQRE